MKGFATRQIDVYTTGCLIDCPYFKEYYKVVAIDPKAIQQVNFTGNLEKGGNTTVLFIIEETKETILNFSQGNVRVLQFYFALI